MSVNTGYPVGWLFSPKPHIELDSCSHFNLDIGYPTNRISMTVCSIWKKRQSLLIPIIAKDGTTADVDVVMMCTGYLHSYPFLRFFIIRMIIVVVLIIMTNREDLRMKSKNLLYPAGMYKGMVWTAGKSETRVFRKFRQDGFSSGQTNGYHHNMIRREQQTALLRSPGPVLHLHHVWRLCPLDC